MHTNGYKGIYPSVPCLPCEIRQGASSALDRLFQKLTILILESVYTMRPYKNTWKIYKLLIKSPPPPPPPWVIICSGGWSGGYHCMGMHCKLHSAIGECLHSAKETLSAVSSGCYDCTSFCYAEWLTVIYRWFSTGFLLPLDAMILCMLFPLHRSESETEVLFKIAWWISRLGLIFGIVLFSYPD